MAFAKFLLLSSICTSAFAIPLRRDDDLMTILTNPSNNFTTGTVLSFPGSSQFQNATVRWESYDPPVYGAAISPYTEEDVLAAMQVMQAHNISFLATGGRHGYGTTFANMNGGVALDLSQMKEITIDSDARTLTVGPGIRFRDMFDPVYEAGFEVQTGTCSCVGMIGATMGAGIGRLDGVYGLMIDALLSVRLVTADGQIITASNDENQELFWGIRGAGFNFGVITAATYQLQTASTFLGGDLKFPASMNATYFETVANITLAPEQTIETIFIWNSTLGEAEILVSTTYAGSEEDGRQALAPLLALNPTYQDIKQIPWNKLSYNTTFGLDTPVCEDTQVYDIYPVNLKTFDVDTMVTVFNKVAQFYVDVPLAQATAITLETWPNQAVLAVPDNTTAYPWRDTHTYLMIQMRWADPNDQTTASAANAKALELRQDLVATSGYDDLAVYVNYAKGDESLESLYGAEKLPRLAALKQQYDPNNVFRYNVPLPTSYP